MPFAFASFAVQLSFDGAAPFGKLLPGTWTTVPVLAEAGIKVRRGIQSTSPTDRMAGPGLMHFTVRNDSPAGYYSPGHASQRAGFGYGIACRLVGTYYDSLLGGYQNKVLFFGRVRRIDPDPGAYRSRLCHITAQDASADLVEARLGDVAIQINKNDIDAMSAIILATPAAVRPDLLALIAATDIYPYTLDDLKAGDTAAGALSRVVNSAWGKLFTAMDGTLTYLSRPQLNALTRTATMSGNDLDEMKIATSFEASYNRVRVTVHPRRKLSAVVLFAITEPILITNTFETIDVWGTYRDPSNTARLVGGFNFISLAAVTDVVANAQADGLGADWTAYLFGTNTPFATTVKFSITNNAPNPVYLTKLQQRGDAIVEDAPITVESFAADTSLGDQTLEIDMPYQNDANFAQDLADYVRTRSSSRVVTSITYNAQKSETQLVRAHTLDIGSVVTLSETQVGLAASDYMIQGVEMSIAPGSLLTVTYTVVPTQQTQAWILDSPVYSQLDSTTVLGFAA